MQLIYGGDEFELDIANGLIKRDGKCASVNGLRELRIQCRKFYHTSEHTELRQFVLETRELVEDFQRRMYVVACKELLGLEVNEDMDLDRLKWFSQNTVQLESALQEFIEAACLKT